MNQIWNYHSFLLSEVLNVAIQVVCLSVSVLVLYWVWSSFCQMTGAKPKARPLLSACVAQMWSLSDKTITMRGYVNDRGPMGHLSHLSKEQRAFYETLEFFFLPDKPKIVPPGWMMSYIKYKSRRFFHTSPLTLLLCVYKELFFPSFLNLLENLQSQILF